MLRRPGKQQPESISGKISRFRGVLLLLSLPLLLFFIIFFLPTRGTYSFSNRKVAPDHRYKNTFAVIVDAGSSGSRVHVFCFDHNLDLVPIGKDIEIFKQLQPGLSAYADNPQRAAASLTSLLEEAEAAVPLELRSSTPVRVGATAGLRALEGDTSDRILQAVRDLLRDRSTLKSEPEGVSVIDGTKEGSYQWVTIKERRS